MLILTRKVGQSVIIGNNIKITIADVSGKQVKIGVEAPQDISIYRLEVYERIREENIRAAEAAKEFLEKMTQEGRGMSP